MFVFVFKCVYSYCRFESVSDYASMVKHLKEGKLQDVKVKGQTYRAVTLERKLLHIHLNAYTLIMVIVIPTN